MRKKNVEAEIEITGWSPKGHGLGYHKEAPVEVQHTMPGDVVQVILLRKRKGQHKTLLQEFIKKSENRTEARCAHFGECGGCLWQHVPYKDQLKRKEAFIKDCLRAAVNEETEWNSIIPCTPPWQYRNKMEFSFSENREGEKFLGLMMAQGRGKVVNLTECHLTDSWFTEALDAVREWWKASNLSAYHHMRDAGHLRTLTVREGKNTGHRLVMLTVSGNPDYATKRSDLDSFVKLLCDKFETEEHPLSVFICIHQIKKGTPTKFYEWKLHGPDFLSERILGVEFQMSPTAFFQPNTQQAEKIYTEALEMADLDKDAVIYDLYCGTGTMGILAAGKVKKVIGIELSREASLDARENAKRNGIENVEVITGDVGEELDRIRKREDFTQPDLVLVDPPRPGLDGKAMKNILDLMPKKILYISCNPKTQGQNLEEFVGAGYVLTKVQPVEQFPHTPHVENIALLEYRA